MTPLKLDSGLPGDFVRVIVLSDQRKMLFVLGRLKHLTSYEKIRKPRLRNPWSLIYQTIPHDGMT